MAYTEDDLDKLKKAVASGVRSVTFSDGRSVVYRTMDELQIALGQVQSELNAAAGVKPRRQIRYVTDKGL